MITYSSSAAFDLSTEFLVKILEQDHFPPLLYSRLVIALYEMSHSMNSGLILYASIYLSIYLSIFLSVYLFIYLLIYLFTHFHSHKLKNTIISKYTD